MKKLLLVAVILLVVLAGGGVALYASGALRPPELEAVHLSWGKVTAQETEVNAQVRLNNRSIIGLGSGVLGAEVTGSFYDTPTLSIVVPQLHLPKGEATINAEGTFRQIDLPAWWPAFVGNGEVLDIHVKPVLTARLLGRTFSFGLPAISTQAPVPLMRNLRNDQAQTMGFDTTSPLELISDPKGHFVVGPPRPALSILTIESWELHWGPATQETSRVQGTVVLRNETSVPLIVQGIRLAVTMNDVGLIPEAEVVPDDPVLPSGGAVPMRLDVTVSNARLVEWLTSHLEAEERTTVTTQLGLKLALPGALFGGFTNDVELPVVPLPGFACDVTTDVMGMANYHIASALGKGDGPVPTPYTVKCGTPQTPALVSGGG